MLIHRRTHPNLDVEGCFGCRITSIGIGAEAMPTRTPEAIAKVRMEKEWAKDHPAYKSMRAQGLQPTTSVGAHRLMTTAKTAEEVEGRPKLWAQRDEILTGAPPERVP